MNDASGAGTEGERLDGDDSSGVDRTPALEDRTGIESLPSIEEVRSWVGFKLDDMEGSTAARVEGAFVDPDDGLPRWVVVRLGRLGRRTVVPAALVVAGVKRLWAPYPKERIRATPQVDPAAGLTASQEMELCDHFGLGSDDARRAELVDRDGDARTSAPPARG